MVWDSEKIKDLRLRLGYSTSDLARHLNCESVDIRTWEIGTAEPNDEVLQKLELLLRQADFCADELACNPLADNLLDADDLGQIDLASVKSRFSENN
jgi:transcriptional regulator with XRE-family HTH domain